MGRCWPRLVDCSLGRLGARRRHHSKKRRRPRQHVSSFLAARERFFCKSVKRRVAMKRILGILAGVAALLVVIWVILESREGSYSSSYASQPETPAPQQSAGASFTYNFDSDAVGGMPAKFHSARTGKGAESKWVVMADSTAPSKPNVVAQTSTDTTDYRFPLLISDEGSFKDLDLSVKF